MDYRFDEVPVDSGVIVIADKSHYEGWGIKDNWRLRGTPTPPAYKAQIDNGTYKANWEVYGIRKAAGKGILEITSGEMWVSDPCYLVFDEKWREYMDKFLTPRKKPKGILFLDKHAGDGGFTVFLKLEKT